MARKICGDFISVINEIADYALVETMSLLRKEKSIYRQRIKQLANLCCENKQKTGLHDLVARGRNRAPRQDIYVTYVDACNDAIAHDVQILEMTILNELARCNVPHRKLFAKIELTRILLIMSKQAFEEIFDQIQKHNMYYDGFESFRRCYNDYYVGHVLDLWENLCSLVFNGKGYKCNLNDSPQILAAYEVILKKYMNASFLDEGAQQTIEEFPDIKPKDIDNL